MHCFDYLRQTVACQSDVTLEGITGESSARNYEIDGYDVMHTCKNQVCYEWLVFDVLFRSFACCGSVKTDYVIVEAGW